MPAPTLEACPARARFWAWYTAAWRHATAVAVLLLAVLVTYRPALRHPPRQDQWTFLLETSATDRFVPLVLQTYSFNRTALVSWGDYPLFRPGLFALLSLEKALFGARYACWQATGIALHCAIVLVFLRILLRLHAAYPAGSAWAGRLRLALAYAVALFFAVNFAGTEMVIWHHIHGYMLFVLLVLGSWLLLLDELCDLPAPRQRPWRLGGAFVLTLLSAFTYETGAYYAVCLGAVLALVAAGRRRLRRGLLLFALFAAVLPIFRAADWLDRLSHRHTRPDITEATVWEHARWEPTAEHAKRYLLFTLCQPFFPSCPEWSFQDRLTIPEPVQAPGRYWRADPVLFVSYAAALAAAGLALVQLARILAGGRPLAALAFLLVPVSLLALHLAIIVLGRMNLRPGPTALARNTYYAYTPFLALLVSLYYLWVRAPLPRPREALAVPALVLAGLVGLSLFSAHKVRAMTEQITIDMRDLRHQIDCAQRLIDRHGRDPHFAISFDPGAFNCLGNYMSVSYLEILFRRYFDHEHPTHVICRDGETWYALSAEEYRDRRDGEAGYRGLAAFVRPGNAYMVLRRGPHYYGVHWQEGRFQPDRDDYCYLLEGDSVADVLSQIPAALARREPDAQAGRFIWPGTPITEMEEGYRGFTLYQVGDHVYAIPEEEGPLNRAYLLNGQYSRWYRGRSVADVQRSIDAGECVLSHGVMVGRSRTDGRAAGLAPAVQTAGTSPAAR